MGTPRFRRTQRRGILTLTLDTPGSSVNIFDEAAAQEVLEAMRGLDPQRTRVVVFRSAKPDSFINGARLMALYHVRKASDVPRLSRDVRAAYHAVRDAPVPTVAAIRGNCYGCGVEFALHCRHRVAADTYDTHFYMTEVNDYLVLPAFGALRLLPWTVGLGPALDLMLWGHRWSARQAAEGGLVDQVFDDDGFDAAVERYVEQVATGQIGRTPRRGYVPTPGARAKIRDLPPQYQDVYRDTLRVMEGWARSRPAAAPALEHDEESAFARAVMEPRVKAALSYFFISQTSQGYCQRGPAPQSSHVHLSVAGAGLASLERDLAGRRLSHVRVGGSAEVDAVSLRFVPHGVPADPGDVAVALGPVTGTVQGGTTLYGPLYPHGATFFELAVRDEPGPSHRTLFHYLYRAGFQAVLTRPGEEFELNRWLRAWFIPIDAYLAGGGRPADVHATLRRAGFVRRSEHPWWAASSRLDLGSSTYEGGRSVPRLRDALLLSLAARAWRSLQLKTLPHPSCADVMARELFSFPLHLGSLCSNATRELVGALRHGALKWIREDDFDAIDRYLSGPRSFYG